MYGIEVLEWWRCCQGVRRLATRARNGGDARGSWVSLTCLTISPFFIACFSFLFLRFLVFDECPGPCDHSLLSLPGVGRYKQSINQ